MNTTYGIGGALQNLGGSMMSMAFSNMQDKKIEERKRQAQEAERLLEEAKVARTRLFKDKAGNLSVEEFNASGRPIGMRPASESESFAASQEEAALLKAQQEAEMKRAREEEEFGMKKEKHKSSLERDKASIASSRANAEYLKSGGVSGKPVDPFADESDLAYLVGTKEGGAGIDAEYQAELAKAVNGAQAMGVDEAKLALTRREIARIFINKLKRLPNKAKEE